MTNATSKEDVKAGIGFVTKNNIRLNLKSIGHDYMGRVIHRILSLESI